MADEGAAPTVVRIARAKINLALHITGRRADGYHLLDSLVAFADFGDRIVVQAAQTLTLTVAGPMGMGLAAGADNLVMRAAQVISLGQGAAITLEKHLPVASGIGGGSADAAAALEALAELWDCPMPVAEDVLALGADVPVCLAAKPARMAGIGEVITPVTLPPVHVVLVNPGFALATADVFKALTGHDNPGLPAFEPWPDAAALAQYLQTCRNDLEPAARALAPEVGTVVAELWATSGCLIARMSGSGATCFGLYATAAEAASAAEALALVHAEWWVRAGALAG